MRSIPFGPRVVFFPEFLDTVRFQNPDHEGAVVQFLRSKYASQKVDVVLAAGMEGLRFAIKHAREIFGNAPRVFAGVEESRLRDLQIPPGFTGVTHFDDVHGALNVALALQPDTTDVVIISGSSEYDRKWFQRDRPIFDEFSRRVRVRYLTDLSMVALLRELRNLKPHTVVFVRSLYRDAAGAEFNDAEMLDLINRNSNAPVYGLTTAVGMEGFVGGPPTGNDDRRYAIALEIVRRILGGEKVSEIPVQQARSEYRYIFDARQLARWNISSLRVPLGSLIRHQTPSFWQLHWKWIVGLASFITLESALIVLLLLLRSRQKKAEALLSNQNIRLRESEQSLRKLNAQLIYAQEDERKRIARQLHDDLNQQVADISISLSKIKKAASTSVENTISGLISVQHRLLTLAEGLRHISHELHPDDEDLVPGVSPVSRDQPS